MLAPNRGEVWAVALDPTKGREQGGTRPCMVLSVNKFNHGPADLIIVVPITSSYKAIASHVKVLKGEAGLDNDSYIKCEEVRCVSKERLKDLWGKVEPNTLRSVEQLVKVILGL